MWMAAEMLVHILESARNVVEVRQEFRKKFLLVQAAELALVFIDGRK